MRNGYNGFINTIKGAYGNAKYYPLSEQLELYFTALGATEPQNAPNYDELPEEYGDQDGFPKNFDPYKPLFAPNYDERFFKPMYKYEIIKMMGL